MYFGRIFYNILRQCFQLKENSLKLTGKKVSEMQFSVKKFGLEVESIEIKY